MEWLKFALISLMTLLASAQSAYAYIDPGTGSMILSAIVGGVAMVGASIGIFWSRVTSFFRPKRPPSEDGARKD